MNPGFTQASAKRRRALLESNPPSNSRRVRLRTAAEGGGPLSPSPSPQMPMVRTLWLKNSRSRAQRGEDSAFRLPHDPLGRALQACLIACNLRHIDALVVLAPVLFVGVLNSCPPQRRPSPGHSLPFLANPEVVLPDEAPAHATPSAHVRTCRTLCSLAETARPATSLPPESPRASDPTPEDPPVPSLPRPSPPAEDLLPTDSSRPPGSSSAPPFRLPGPTHPAPFPRPAEPPEAPGHSR